MPVLTGVLLDVSGSMECSIGGKVKEEGGSWAQSIFKVVDELIKNDVTETNQVFALGVGAYYQPVFDLLNTLKRAKPSRAQSDGIYLKKQGREAKSPLSASCLNSPERSLKNILYEALSILERKGAPSVHEWAKMDLLVKTVRYEDAVVILDKLQHDPEFTTRFVFDCLPKQCRECVSVEVGKCDTDEVYSQNRGEVQEMPFVVKLVVTVLQTLIHSGSVAKDKIVHIATESAIKETIRKGMQLLMVGVGEAAVLTVQEAHEILYGCVGESELTDERVDELMEAVRPFIFGVTPLMEALDEARSLFALPQYKNHHKLLFVLSDGMPTDGNTPPLKALSDLGVRVVSCFITDRSISDPFHLYSHEEQEWEEPAKFMFRMSSTIKTEWIPRNIFVKRGWKIDIENNETKLFCQVNHPDIIKDVCDLGRNIVCSQDALADILASVSLDVYINQTKERFGAKEQEGGTCYANATAAVLHLAMRRIVGRVGGYPDFFEIRKRLIEKYGEHGANTLQVLREICPQYRLQCEEVDVAGAMKAVAAKRPVIARFWLTDPEWESFSKFYRDNPCGILTKSEIDISKRPPGAELRGHAVVLTSYDSESLRFMNSWGSDWADGGFFRVQNAGVLGLEFVDVFWTLDDLKQEEKDAYARHGPDNAKKLLSSLQGLQSAQYKCPLCHVESKLSDFTGHLREVKCLKCGGTFSTKDAGDDLALNMYLTALIR